MIQRTPDAVRPDVQLYESVDRGIYKIEVIGISGRITSIAEAIFVQISKAHSTVRICMRLCELIRMRDIWHLGSANGTQKRQTHGQRGPGCQCLRTVRS